MNEKTDKIILPHSILLKDRSELSVSGVTDVDSFDEQVIVACTDMGELTISGEGLHITCLNIEKGELSVEGKICAMSYLERPERSGGFFSKVFR
ncbi:MAG: sporulation protein YabP [Oscillospiraceae bacterium]|nr:sporulation protein YabP [Oscillospiraceae bacterium]